METPNKLSDLIKALQLLQKYDDPAYPTHCDHDILRVCIKPEKVSDEDKIELERLGFHPDEELSECFASSRFGSN